MYLTYTEYAGYGGTAAEAAFPVLEFQARKVIDYLTADRVQNMAEVPESVKLCMTSIININASTGAEAQVSNPAVTSFNTDGYSESYGNAYNADESAKQIKKLVVAMLYGEYDDNGVPLLYRGARG